MPWRDEPRMDRMTGMLSQETAFPEDPSVIEHLPKFVSGSAALIVGRPPVAQDRRSARPTITPRDSEISFGSRSIRSIRGQSSVESLAGQFLDGLLKQPVRSSPPFLLSHRDAGVGRSRARHELLNASCTECKACSRGLQPTVRTPERTSHSDASFPSKDGWKPCVAS